MTLAAPSATPQRDVERARANMIEQQIRTWEVLDNTVLELLAIVRREEFVPPALRELAFVDMELPLRLDGVDTGEAMFAPKMEARFIQELALGARDNVLEIGTGSGYLAALAAHRAQSVVSVEIDPRLRAFAQANLLRAGVHNVRVDEGDGARGWDARAPYDAIIVGGALPAIPQSLIAQLRIVGRMAVIVGEAPAMSAQIVTRVSETATDTLRIFETTIKPLRNAWRPSTFRF